MAGLKSNSVDLDDIKLIFIKKKILMTVILNFCLTRSQFSDLRKKWNTNLASDFKPFNIICVVSKAFEKFNGSSAKE